MLIRTASRAVWLAACVGGLSTQAASAHDPGFLTVVNKDHRPVTITLSKDNNNCYEGDPGLGKIWLNLPPGGHADIMLSRQQGHGCNGRQGEFELQFDPKVGVGEFQHFDFDNGGHLELTTGPDYPNPYPGTLKTLSDANRQYEYDTFATPDITAGPAVGSWKLICQQICNRSTTEQKTQEHTTSKKFTEEESNSIATSLEVGVSKGGFQGALGGSAKVSVTHKWEKKIGHEMAEEFRSGETHIDTSNYSFTPEQMKAFNIFAIWQWVATTKLSDGEQIMIGSNKFTCTPDAEEPDYLPGTDEDIGACTGNRKPRKPDAAEVETKPTPTPISAKVDAPKPVKPVKADEKAPAPTPTPAVAKADAPKPVKQAKTDEKAPAPAPASGAFACSSSAPKIALRTSNGRFLTVVDDGGLDSRNRAAIDTNRHKVGAWEKFTFVPVDAAKKTFALKTMKGGYVTAVNGGGMGGPDDDSSPIHTDAKSVGAWETLTLELQQDGSFAFCSKKGYLTAVSGGGWGEPGNTKPIRTDAKAIGPWETFSLVTLPAK